MSYEIKGSQDSEEIPGEDLKRNHHNPGSDEGQKFDDGKRRWSLLPWGPLGKVVDVLDYGARKYAPGNWMRVKNAQERYANALLRHTAAYLEGEKNDPETGLPHLAHAACCVLFLLWFEEKRDRP